MAMVDTSQASCSWEKLPEDCWGIILSKLEKVGPVTLVCKRFLAITNVSRTNLRIPNPKVLAFSSTVPPASLYTRFPNLTSLRIESPLQKLGRFVGQVASSGLPLQSIHLSQQTYFPRKAMRYLGSRMHSTLRSLACTYFDSISEDDVLVIANCFSYLQHLNLYRSYLRSPKYISTDEICKVISTKLVSLISFSVNVVCAYSHDNPSGHSFHYLSSHCPLLSEIKASFDGMTPGELDWFASFTSLRSLDLTSVNISDIGLVHLTGASLKLRKLSLSYHCSSGYLGDNVTNGLLMCGFLKSLCFLTDLFVFGYSFSPDTKEIDFAACFPKCIEMITFWRCFGLPNTFFLDVLKNCPKLKSLDLDDGVTIVDDLLPLRIHNNLKSLCLDGTALSDKTVKLISCSCPMLEYFHIRDSFQVTKQGMEEIIASCSNLNFCSTSPGFRGKSFSLRSFKPNCNLDDDNDNSESSMEKDG